MFFIEAKHDKFLPKYKNSGYQTYSEANNHNNMIELYNISVSKVPVREGRKGKGE